MEVYKAQAREIIRQFREHRITNRHCTAMLNAAVAEVVLRISPEQLPELQVNMLENNRIMEQEKNRRALLQKVN
jgi:hypothetical protein